MREIASSLATVVLYTDRWCLLVADLIVAGERDPCRDPMFAGSRWTKHTLEQAAARINRWIDQEDTDA